jgi:hypothetical protein
MEKTSRAKSPSIQASMTSRKSPATKGITRMP